MNIFVLDKDPKLAAQAHCDQHVLKMILEYAQMLSTAHRINDGVAYDEVRINKKGNKYRIARWAHPKQELDDVLYLATHYNHPCSKWVRATRENYLWMFHLWAELCVEYRVRWQTGRAHGSWTKLKWYLSDPPRNIWRGFMTEWPLAMDDEYKLNDVVSSYRNFYNQSKSLFATWTFRDIPEWYKESEYVN